MSQEPRKIIVGDIHGCYRELMELLNAVGFSNEDELIALGDIVDRGPDSSKVVEYFHANRQCRCILGNHERKHLRWGKGILNPAVSQQLARNQFTDDGYTAAIAYFGSLPNYIELPEALLVHGFFEPGVPLAEQRDNVLVGTLSGEHHLHKHYTRPWYELYDGAKPIAVGHLDYLRNGQPLVHNQHVYAIDTGCCRGGALTALILPGFRLVSVKSHKNYWMEEQSHFYRLSKS